MHYFYLLIIHIVFVYSNPSVYPFPKTFEFDNHNKTVRIISAEKF